MYVGQPSAAGEPPKNLRGFTRISLNAGQTQHVALTLDARSFQYWNNGWTNAAGENGLRRRVVARHPADRRGHAASSGPTRGWAVTRRVRECTVEWQLAGLYTDNHLFLQGRQGAQQRATHALR